MKTNRIVVLTLQILSTISCSQMNSQSDDSNDAGMRIATNGNGGRQSIDRKTPNVESVKEWKGKVGGHYLSWDGKDLNIRLSEGREMETFSDFAREEFRRQVKDEPNTRDCDTSFYYRPLAIAGNLVSFQAEWGALCGAVNTNGWGYMTFELKRDGSFLFHRPDTSERKLVHRGDVYLSDVFSDNEIFKGLLENERISLDISNLRSRGKIDKQPENLSELKRLFERFPYDFLDGRFYLNANLLEGFAIHHLEDEKVAVWLSLLPSSQAGHAVREHLEVKFPLPAQLREPLRLADSRAEGFLMKDAEQMVGTSFARFEFGGKAN